MLQATGIIKISELRNFLQKLGNPLGYPLDIIGDFKKESNFIVTLQLPIYNNFTNYHYYDVLSQLALKSTVYEHVQCERKKHEEASEQAKDENEDYDEDGDEGDGSKQVTTECRETCQ